MKATHRCEGGRHQTQQLVRSVSRSLALASKEIELPIVDGGESSVASRFGQQELEYRSRHRPHLISRHTSRITEVGSDVGAIRIWRLKFSLRLRLIEPLQYYYRLLEVGLDKTVR